MIDALTNAPLRVSTENTPRPYITLAVTQLDEVQGLLTRHGVPHWVDEDFLSFNGGPEEAIIELGRGADAKAVQAILDGIP